MTFGFTAGASYAFLPRLVAACAAAMPDVDLVPREMPTAGRMEALAAGLVRPPVDRRGVELARVARDAMLLAAPRGHALAVTGATPGLRDLDRVPFVMYWPTGGRYFYDSVSGLFRAAELAPDRVQHISQVHTILAPVGAGMGACASP